MALKKIRLSLGKRLLFLVLVGVLLSFGILTFLIVRREKAILMDFNQEKSSQLAESITRNLRAAMLEKDPAVVKRMLSEQGSVSGVKAAVLRSDGSLAYGEIDYRIPSDMISHPKEASMEFNGGLVFVKPLLNEEVCHGCHSPADKTRGFVAIGISTEEVVKEIRETRRRIAFFAILTAFLSGSTLIFFLRKMVLNPLAVLKDGTEKIRDGDLGHRIRINTDDELGNLAVDFNLMTEKIENARHHLEEAVQRKTKDLRVIARLSTEVFRGDLTLYDIIERFLQTTTEDLGYSFCTVCLMDKETGILHQEFKRGLEEQLCETELALADDHPFSRTLREAKPTIKRSADLGIPHLSGWLAIVPIISHQKKRCRAVNLCPYTDCPAFDHADERCWLIEGTLCRSPQAIKGRAKIYGCLHCQAFPLIGVLIAGSKGEIGKSSLHSLEIIASEIASAIENYRLIDEKRRDIKELIRLHDVSVESLKYLSMDELKLSIVASGLTFARSDAAILWLISDEGKLTRQKSAGIDESMVPDSISAEEGFVGRAIIEARSIETVKTGDIECLRDVVVKHGFLYASSIPLVDKDSTIGCLTLFKKNDFFMTDSERAIITLYASQAASAIRTARIYEALRASEERYKELIESAKDAIFTLSPEGTFLSLNPAFESITGWPRTEWLGKHFGSILHPDDLPLAIEVFQKVMGGEVSPAFELRVQASSGSYIVGELVTTPHMQNDKVVGLLGIGRDVTDRKRTEEALYAIIEKVSRKTGKEFFESLVLNLAKTLQMDSAIVGELSADEKRMRTIAVSSGGRIVENFEYSLPGSPCEIVIAERALRFYPSGVQRLFPDDPLLVDMRVESYIGSPLFDSTGNSLGILIAVDGKPLPNTRLAESIFRIYSVRAAAELERMRFEEELRSEKEFSDVIFSNISSGLMVLDREGSVLKINDSGARILKTEASEIVGRKLLDIYPETYPMLSIEPNPNGEVTLNLPDGDSIPVGFTNSPLYDPPEEGGIIVLFKDMTEIKELQAELKKKQHFESMGKVISGVAHEVRNPLFAIQSIAQIIERESESPQHQALLKAMLKESYRMKNLIDELLLFSRPSKLNVADIDLDILISELREFARTKDYGAVVSAHVSFPAVIRADRDKILQVFLNLLDNAVGAGTKNVDIAVKKKGEEVVVTVKDEGLGIKEENLEKVFDPFHTTKREGTGLGLPICKKIMEDHGGKIEIQSREGEGTTVILTFKA